MSGKRNRQSVPGSNGAGTVTVTVAAELSAYESLPPPIRRALRECRVDINSLQILAVMRHVVRGRMSLGALAEAIRIEGERIAREEERRLYGVGP